MSENSDYSVLGSTLNNPNGIETTTADALSAALRIGSMVFSSWLRSLVSKLFKSYEKKYFQICEPKFK